MKEHPERIRVLLIEHNRLLLDGLCRLLWDAPDTELVGSASSASAGMTLSKQVGASVIVLDLELPEISAARFVEQLRHLQPDVYILVLATYALDPAGAEAIACGAAGIVAKDQIASRLIPLILSSRSRRS